MANQTVPAIFCMNAPLAAFGSITPFHQHEGKHHRIFSVSSIHIAPSLNELKIEFSGTLDATLRPTLLGNIAGTTVVIATYRWLGV